MKVAELCAERLAARGVRWAFGMPGGEVLALLDAFAARGIEFVLVRDEASAGFMADAVWQLTGAPAVALATLGPGATNLVSGVAGAHLDRARVVAILGRMPQDVTATYTHQVLDQRALFAPITKHGVTLSARHAAHELRRALRELQWGRPGPVLLEVPTDVLDAEVDAPGHDEPTLPALQPDPHAVLDARALLSQARRPVVLVGHAAAPAGEALRTLANDKRIPVLSTYRGKGVLPENDPWSLGAAGLSPVVDAMHRQLLATADVLVTVGYDPVEMRPDWLPGWPADVPVVALDAWPPLDLPHPVAAMLLGPVARTIDVLDAVHASSWIADEIASHRGRWRSLFEDGPLGPGNAVRAMRRALPDHAVVTLDVGAHRITASHAWQARVPGRLLQSNGLSSMGFGLPAAIAARLVVDRRTPVVALTGDAGFQMVLGELGIVRDRRLDLVVVVFRDESLALIEIKQERSGYTRRGVRFTNPDVASVAASFGGVGVALPDWTSLEDELAAALKRGGLSVIEVGVDQAIYRRQM